MQQRDSLRHVLAGRCWAARYRKGHYFGGRGRVGVCVCVGVSVLMCLYVRVRVCARARVYVCECERGSVYDDVCVCTCVRAFCQYESTQVWKHACVSCLCVCVSVCLAVCLSVCLRVGLHVCIHE